MDIGRAQLEIRRRFHGGAYGQLVSGLLWLASAALATWGSPRSAIATLVIGGFFIFPATEVLVRLVGRQAPMDAANPLTHLGMQVAFVLPLSMPLLVPIARYNLGLFYPAMMVLLGAHYLPFVFLYGMRMFVGLTALLVGGGITLAMNRSDSFSAGAWYTAIVLVIFAAVGAVTASRAARRP